MPTCPCHISHSSKSPFTTKILVASRKLIPFLLSGIEAHDVEKTPLEHFKIWPVWLGQYYWWCNTYFNWSKSQNLLNILGKGYSPISAEYEKGLMQPSSWRKGFETLRGILQSRRPSREVETRKKKKRKSMFWPGNISGVLAQASGRVFELGLQLLKLNVFKQKYQYYIYIF